LTPTKSFAFHIQNYTNLKKKINKFKLLVPAWRKSSVSFDITPILDLHCT
jgi:hypothetical protein